MERITKKNEESNRNIRLDGPIFTKFLNNNLTKFPNKNNMIMDLSKLLSKCHNTDSDVKKNNPSVGIVIGRVQSGKTTFFLSSLALAFDNNFDVATVFTGTKNNLKDQTLDRVKTNFTKTEFDNVTILDSSDFILNNSSDSKRKLTEQIDINVKNGKKIIIVALKHYKHITFIGDLMRHLSDEFNHIVIDDEGDQASLNTKVRKQDFSSTYKAFRNLIDVTNRISFISVTATPQANLFIETVDILSPDFSLLINPGKGYVGGEIFHGENEKELVKTIDNMDVDDVLNNELPESLDEAIRVFLLGAIIKRRRGDSGIHTMLIHNSHLTKEHDNMSDIVGRFVTVLREVFQLNKTEDLLVKEYNKFEEVYNNMCEDFDYGYDFEEHLKYNLKSEIDMLGVQIINSSTDYESTEFSLYNNIIFIGGNMVERGVTIENLAVTYITRHPKGKANIDTVLQRARWFGYKQAYIDLCRVYCTKKLRNNFSSILTHENDLWEVLKYADYNNIDLSEYAFDVIIDNPDLHVTRGNILVDGNPIKHMHGIYSQKKFKVDSEKQNQFVTKIDELFQNHQSKQILHQNNQTDLRVSIDTGKLQQLLDFLVKNNLIVEEKLYMWFKKIVDKYNSINIYYMRYKMSNQRNFSERSFHSNTIHQLLQGRSIKGKEYYLGDREVYSNTPHIQFHIVKPKENFKNIDKVVYMAINIPIKDAEVIAERKVKYD